MLYQLRRENGGLTGRWRCKLQRIGQRFLAYLILANLYIFHKCLGNGSINIHVNSCQIFIPFTVLYIYCLILKSKHQEDFFLNQDLKAVMEIRLFQDSGSLSISPEDLILHFFGKHVLPVLEISKRNVFFLGTSSEYLTRYGQGSVFKDPLKQRILVYISLNIHLTFLRIKQKFQIFLMRAKNVL